MLASLRPSTSALQSLRRSICTCAPRLAKPSNRLSPASVPKSPPKHRKARALSPDVPQTELFQRCATFPAIVHRPTLINEESARRLVRAWGLHEMKDVTVIEAYAGPGGLTRAMLELPNVKKVIAIEEAFRYVPILEELKTSLADPSRLEILQKDPFAWETYSEIESLGYLKDVPKHPWESGVHPSLFLACQLPNTRHGDQLLYQFLSTAVGKMWLYQYGRFSSGYLGPISFWDKIAAVTGTPAHHKLSVLIPALGDLQRLHLLDNLVPAEQHFHRPRGDPASFSPVKVTPHAKPLANSHDALEFVTRNMFVAKNQPWQKGVANLSTGAVNLVPLMIKAGMPSEPIIVNKLSLQHWIIIADIYNDWPFRPQTLFDDLQFHAEG